MSVKYLDVSGITDACKEFRDKIEIYDECVTGMESETNKVLANWTGKGRNQFETQMNLMKSQLDDISEILYDIYNALLDAETAYIDEDQEVAKQISTKS